MFSSTLSIICFDIAMCPFCFLTHQAACLIVSPCLYASMKRKLRLQKRRRISVVQVFKAKGTSFLPSLVVFLTTCRDLALAYPQYISMGLSSQWNLGRKTHLWPLSSISCAITDCCSLKSLWFCRIRAIQQVVEGIWLDLSTWA